ncbi:MAG: hypothetical protein FWC13_08215 [Oscillospiraceae bacterium]|nr:hypothetical protein [Oscillospiraceae bacterium]
MNKLEGFYELNKVGLPSVPWKKFANGITLDENVLWTVRSAVLVGDDMNLPRKVGVSAGEAKNFAENLINSLSDNGMVLYYPFFVAEKSGMIEVSINKVIIEAVRNDLWNLVTLNNRDVTVISDYNSVTELFGNEDFLESSEISELLKYSNRVKMKYKNLLIEGQSLFLEWSYSFCSDINKNPIGDRSLVFYEIRSVS